MWRRYDRWFTDYQAHGIDGSAGGSIDLSFHLLGMAGSFFPVHTFCKTGDLSCFGPIRIDQTLKEQTGAGYREAGGYLGKLWCLPEPLAQTMEFHEKKDYRNKGWEMSLLVGVAISMIAAAELNLKWSPLFDTLEILEIKPAEAEKIFDNLRAQLERIQQSAAALIGH